MRRAKGLLIPCFQPLCRACAYQLVEQVLFVTTLFTTPLRNRPQQSNGAPLFSAPISTLSKSHEMPDRLKPFFLAHLCSGSP